MADTITPRTGFPAARQDGLGPKHRAELYETVITLLCDLGYNALTMEAVAARLHCSKATLYRRFSGKHELVLQALRHLSPFDVDIVDSGSLAGDLHGLIERRGEERLHQDGALIRGLMSPMHTHPDLVSALRRPGPGRLDAVVARAVERGELISREQASDRLPLLLLAGVLACTLIGDPPLGGAYLHRFVDAVVLPALSVTDSRAAADITRPQWYLGTNIASDPAIASLSTPSLDASQHSRTGGRSDP
ncbi:TetR/AcrR family transcriptional regulator [Streptomyces sp. NPDC090075]|uniref:TetR/AcrR family transcriptional regulator n=1 Tax=Streptomyces sp. NPDC090075 TaxID=3365937 RepID=UPI003828EA72